VHEFDILDSSFLFPLPTKSGFKIKAFNRAAPDTSIYTFHEFKQLPGGLRNFLPGVKPEDLLDRLYITGLRFDPCFPKVPDNLDPFDLQGCQFRAVRLVGQFVDIDAPDPTAIPASMHILFLIGPLSPVDRPGRIKDVNDILAKLASLKQIALKNGADTKGRGLGVHPGFGHAEFEARLVEIIRGIADHRKLFGTSVFYRLTDKDGMTTWTWQQLINTLLLGKAEIAGIRPEPLFQVFPTTGRKPGLLISWSSKLQVRPGKNMALTPTNRELEKLTLGLDQFMLASSPRGITSLDGPSANENPKFVGIPNGPCVNCHIATQLRLNAKAVNPKLTNSSFEFAAKPGITGKMAPEILKTMTTPIRPIDPDSFIVINFGYHGKSPVVSQRTVNEAARATELINGVLLKPNWTP
jgi:hypothetical protein